MALSYAKRNPSSKIRESSNINGESNEIPQTINKFFVDTRYMLKDEKENIWVYAPLSDQFYLYYNKKEDQYTMTCYPTSRSKITSDCKSGLRFYKKPEASSDVLKRIKQQEVLEATSHFHIDDDGDIWTFVLLIPDTKNPEKVIEGWVIYKNKRNNFVNFLYSCDTTMIIRDGFIDPERVKKLGSELFLQTKERKYFGKNFLQFFAESSVATAAKAGASVAKKTTRMKGKFVEIKELISTTYKVSGSARAFNSKYYEENGNRKKDTQPGVTSITAHGPKTVQNAYSFPTKTGTDKAGTSYYNYSMNYKEDNIFGDIFHDELKSDLKTDLSKLYQDINYDVQLPEDIYKNMFERYNRFKLAVPGDYLSRGFAHVFFTRPDCNVIDASNNLVSRVKLNANFDYAFCHRKRLITNLTLKNKKQDFNLFLSNKAEEFTLNDESITTGQSGPNWRKQQVVYGKSNVESKASGEFTVRYTDNRELDIFHYHKLWTDYISNVYTGLWNPYDEYLWQKTIDYACCAYYILTAEDGETILFWSKYYGVFPVNVPSSSYSWSKGNVITSPELSINYQYTMKEDFNPVSLVEFNLNSGLEDGDSVSYIPSYDEKIGGSGYTWVGTPFIETCKTGTGKDKDYCFKLRFKVPK